MADKAKWEVTVTRTNRETQEEQIWNTETFSTDSVDYAKEKSVAIMKSLIPTNDAKSMKKRPWNVTKHGMLLYAFVGQHTAYQVKVSLQDGLQIVFQDGVWFIDNDNYLV